VGAFAVYVDGEDWFQGSSTRVYAGGHWYSSSSFNLTMSLYSSYSGSDKLGQYDAHQFDWSANYDSHTQVILQTTVFDYSSYGIQALRFQQYFPITLNNTNAGSSQTLMSVFPSLSVEGLIGDSKGYFVYNGQVDMTKMAIILRITVTDMWFLLLLHHGDFRLPYCLGVVDGRRHGRIARNKLWCLESRYNRHSWRHSCKEA
jgi:hypothetical protein